MSGRIRDVDVTYVREHSPIDEVVGEYVQLKGAGGGQKKGLCPFHDEKTPSFHVTPSRGYFHCFGCQTGGDVIAFMMKIDHLTFTETITFSRENWLSTHIRTRFRCCESSGRSTLASYCSSCRCRYFLSGAITTSRSCACSRSIDETWI